jgi:hypothetical protein
MIERTPWRNALVPAGILLLLLGAGNWIVGAARTVPYSAYLGEDRGPRERTSDLKTRLLAPTDTDLEARNVARAKLEFYELVLSGGRLMAAAGALCLLAGLVAAARDRRGRERTEKTRSSP